MKHIFKVENVKCSGCANTLKSKLRDKFGEIDVNLEIYPREITLDIEPDSIAQLQIALKRLGYPFSSDRLGFVDTTTTKAKSFVSCAVGKIES
jgi:copper chaperone CopZ